jgi:hypothetical protein
VPYSTPSLFPRVVILKVTPEKETGRAGHLIHAGKEAVHFPLRSLKLRNATPPRPAPTAKFSHVSVL